MEERSLLLGIYIIDNYLGAGGFAVSSSTSRVNVFLLASPNLLRNILKRFAKFWVNTLRLSACCCAILANIMLMLLFSETCFGSCLFCCSGVKVILKSSSEFWFDKLRLVKFLITVLKTCDSLDKVRFKSYFPFVLPSRYCLFDNFCRNGRLR